jgi:hypothetical protein
VSKWKLSELVILDSEARKMIWIWIKKTFRGLCEKEGCNKARMRYFSYCHGHQIEWAQEVGEQIRKEKFERDVNVHLEALRRFQWERRGT